MCGKAMIWRHSLVRICGRAGVGVFLTQLRASFQCPEVLRRNSVLRDSAFFDSQPSTVMHSVTAWIPCALSPVAAESAVRRRENGVGGIKGGKSTSVESLESAVESPWTKKPCFSEI